jgi:DNA-binding MarR family transcriptional regulator
LTQYISSICFLGIKPISTYYKFDIKLLLNYIYINYIAINIFLQGVNIMKKLHEVTAKQEKPNLTEQDIIQERSHKAQNLLKSLRIIFRSIQSHSRLVEKESGVTSAQLWMMWEIFNAPGMKVTELASVLSIHQSTCSNILDKLQQKGLIKRERSGPDQRVVHLHLTEKGTKLLAQAPRPAQGAIADVLQRLPDNVLNNMDESLADLVGALHITEKDAELKPLDL